MKRNFRILLLLALINVQGIRAVMISGDGITTEKGFLSWENFYTMSDRLDSLERYQRIFIIGTIALASGYLYYKWLNDETKYSSQKIISDLDDIENSNRLTN